MSPRLIVGTCEVDPQTGRLMFIPQRCRPGSGHSPQNGCGCWRDIFPYTAPGTYSGLCLTEEQLTPDPYHYLIAARLVHEGYRRLGGKKYRKLSIPARPSERHVFTIKVFRAFRWLTELGPCGEGSRAEYWETRR